MISSELNNLANSFGQNSNLDQYQSNRSLQVRDQEHQLVRNNAEACRNPLQTGVIPRAGFNQDIHNDRHENLIHEPNLENRDNQQFYISSLSGDKIPIENFTHSNMQPFYGGSVRQNMREGAHNSVLESHTGTSRDTYQHKSETKRFFELEKDIGYTSGMPNISDEVKDRYIPSQKRQSELPFTQLRVGPGLNQGYGWKPSGGYTQENTRDFVLPKTVDQLRVMTNPKETFKGRIIAGQKERQRPVVNAFKKNRPDTFYRQTPDRYLKTGGAFKAAKLREKYRETPTRRKNTRPYTGIAGPVSESSTYQKAAVRRSSRKNYKNPWQRNVGWKQGWDIKLDGESKRVGDYGKGAIEIKHQERDTTQDKPLTQQSNLRTTVQNLIAPIIDYVRETRKENFIGNIRPSGNFKAQMPERQTVKDPNDVPKTTLKEQLIDNESLGNLGVAMPSKLTVYDPNDVARTTIKETLIDNCHTGTINITKATKLTVYDPNDIPKTTIKEQNIDNSNPYANLVPSQGGESYVYDPNDIPKTTIKETSIFNEHSGHLSGETANKQNAGYKIVNMKPRNTLKEITSDIEYSGNPDGNTGKGGGKGYLTSRVKAKPTIRQFTGTYERKGAGKFSTSQQMSYGAGYNATSNATKEKIAIGREPTNSSVKSAIGKDRINTHIRKLEGDQVNVRNPYESKLYVVPPQKNNCGMTTVRGKLPEDRNAERINPEILDAFRKNPYSHRLDSVF